MSERLGGGLCPKGRQVLLVLYARSRSGLQRRPGLPDTKRHLGGKVTALDPFHPEGEGNLSLLEEKAHILHTYLVLDCRASAGTTP